MKKHLITVVACILVCALSIAGTVAYLTSTDSQHNTMTVGNVKIEQLELQRADGVTYNNGGEIASGDELVPFVQDQLLFPSTYTNLSDYSTKLPNNEQFWWGDYVTADVSGNGSSNGPWDDNLTGAMDKFVFVKNTGTSNCYYRTILAFECPEGMDYSQGSDKEFMNNLNLNSRFDRTANGYMTINGTRYMVLTMTYNQVLEAGKISRPSLLQVVMTHNADMEDMAKIGEKYDVLALSQAAQTDGFTDANHALNTAFGELTEANLVQWLTPVAQQ
jgi:predicted ribosomally synthesized peptide with SipW-like signal peptide